MPDVVAFGRRPDVFACGYCHLPNGQGRPENASLAGLPADYIIEQLAEFKSGRRRSAEPRHMPTVLMIGEAKANDDEIRAAARYFSGLQLKPWIRVVETKMVAKTHVAGWMLVQTEGAAPERIGQRIVETPENLERTELRDDTSGFIAYVPEGSLRRGQSLVKTGESGDSSGVGKTIPCATCHGPSLKGAGNVPALAGRSPSYLVRQMYNIQHGARSGTAVELMKAPVARLTVSDMIAIAAYAASLPAN
jgi:cytochrome c553